MYQGDASIQGVLCSPAKGPTISFLKSKLQIRSCLMAIDWIPDLLDPLFHSILISEEGNSPATHLLIGFLICGFGRSDRPIARHIKQ